MNRRSPKHWPHPNSWIWWLALLIALPFARAAHPVHITDDQAAAHIGETVVLEGRVVQVFTSDNGNIFLNFGSPYPRHRFSATIFSRYAEAFPDIHRLEGKRVQITGIITLYRNKPQILLTSPDQLTPL
jgi:hypothetical protein